MQTHYFQRYHSKENVDTANATLLLSRLYMHTSEKFFNFLKQIVNENIQDFDVELKFNLQEKTDRSVLDASITQDSFKIAVETKLYNNFSLNQLTRHLSALVGYKYQILLTLDPNNIEADLRRQIADVIAIYNKKFHCNIVHIHLTFKDIIDNIRSVLDEQRDVDMLEILDDYEQYCNESGLIPDDWKTMRMVLASTTFHDNEKNNLYYHGRNRGYSAHSYIGLYKEKSIRRVGKIIAVIDSIFDDNGQMHLVPVKGSLTDKIKEDILNAVDDSKAYGYALAKDEHRFFIVDKFFETDFRKISPRAPMGHRYFDLCEILGVNSLPETEIIAAKLKERVWR